MAIGGAVANAGVQLQEVRSAMRYVLPVFAAWLLSVASARGMEPASPILFPLPEIYSAVQEVGSSLGRELYATYFSKLRPVEGRLTVAGKPPQDVVITLVPIDPVDNPYASGICLDDGGIHFYSGVEGRPGAAPGKYKVVLMQRSPPPFAEAFGRGRAVADVPPPSEPTFHSKYLTAATSDLVVTIERRSNVLHLDLDPAEPDRPAIDETEDE